MSLKIVYAYDPKTFEYIGQTFAQTDPMNNSEVLLPPNTTTIAPPKERKPNVTYRFVNNSKWEIAIDYRGTWYNKFTKKEVIIKNLGEELYGGKDNYTKEAPPEDCCIWKNNNWTVPTDIANERKQEEVKSLVLKYIREMQDRVDRYRNQKDIGVNTTDSEETFKLILQYMEYLRKHNDTIDNPKTFTEWR